jgi:hypothetical protein
MKKLLITLFIIAVGSSSLYANKYSFRKYSHVKDFYASITKDAIDISIKYNLPPAAVLTIAGLESGYGRGYVARITGNIMSLGAFKGDKELPRLYLPYSASKKKILFTTKEIKKASPGDLSWKKRPKSYKRDYRPAKFAGTTKNLELLSYDKALKHKANLACLTDFATRWISPTSKVKAFRDTRKWLDKQVKKNGKDILFSMSLNKEFIDRIGGHKNSFNYRKTWPKKAKLIMKKAGLVQLANDIYMKKMNFKDAWRKQ